MSGIKNETILPSNITCTFMMLWEGLMGIAIFKLYLPSLDKELDFYKDLRKMFKF